MMIASAAVHAQTLVPYLASLRVTANTLSMLTNVLIAVLAQALVPLTLLRRKRFAI